MAHRTEQVYDLATVMYRAAQVEDDTSQEMSEKLARLEYENKHLREVLQLSNIPSGGHLIDNDNAEKEPLVSQTPHTSISESWSKIG